MYFRGVEIDISISQQASPDWRHLKWDVSHRKGLKFHQIGLLNASYKVTNVQDLEYRYYYYRTSLQAMKVSLPLTLLILLAYFNNNPL